jgi:hypothetical protein
LSVEEKLRKFHGFCVRVGVAAMKTGDLGHRKRMQVATLT